MTIEEEDILVLKLPHLGANIPYTKVYLFPKSQVGTISDYFPFALVVPKPENFVKELRRIYVSRIETHGATRKEYSQELPKATESFGSVIDLKKVFADRIMVVPMLATKKRGKLRPQYMSQLKMPLPDGELAYLITPYEKPYNLIQPICSVCPNQLQNLAGACKPGEATCLKHLCLSEESIKPSVED